MRVLVAFVAVAMLCACSGGGSDNPDPNAPTPIPTSAPTPVPANPQSGCDPDGICTWPETANTCASDCGSYEVSAYTNQRAKYIGQSCAFNGNGLADQCAAADGQPGRFNELQAALDSLEGGDTLYIYPGHYFRPVTREVRDPYGIYERPEVTAGTQPTSQRPIIITSRYNDDPAILYSYDPAGSPGAERDNSLPALSIFSSDTVVDHLNVVGRVQIWGARRSRIQYCTVRFGWGLCDGNWSAIRVEWSEDVVVHHNQVSDVMDDGMCAGTYDDRPSGLKEFSSQRVIWEFNTVTDVARWGYDLHRSSVDATVRFNRFENCGTGVKIYRTENSATYGNIILAGETCIAIGEIEPAVSQVDVIYNNTCFFAAAGIAFQFSGDVYLPRHSARVENNIVHNLTHPSRWERFNIGLAAGASRISDHNAWDANGRYCRAFYDDNQPCQETLAEWRQALERDPASIAAPGGACAFVDAPGSLMDRDYDARVASTNCLTLGTGGSEIGAYGITECVGHHCR